MKYVTGGVMTEYLAAVGAAEQVEREIAETDQEIDARVYALYGLDAEEIRVVEGRKRYF